MEEAVAIYRRLSDPAAGNPAAHLPDLASSLNNLGIRYSAVGRREEALAPAEEAVAIRRRLAGGDPIPAEYLVAGTARSAQSSQHWPNRVLTRVSGRVSVSVRA